MTDYATYLAEAQIDPEVFKLRPDYRALLFVITGVTNCPSDAESDALLSRAEQFARDQLAATSLDKLPHVAAWREAYKAFGAKPKKHSSSLEALTKRASDGLPRVNKLTDIYNAISVLHQVPLGGEDAARYSGSPRLKRSDGTEAFDTTASGATVIEHPDKGEVVWTDSEGVTCRRWNWRQGVRTRLTEKTQDAIFICDALEPMDDAALEAMAEELISLLLALGPDAKLAARRGADSSRFLLPDHPPAADKMPSFPWAPFLAGGVSRLFLRYACKEVKVEGLPAFMERIKSDRGILTVANHVSVCDEPFMWGVLPLSFFCNTNTVRWTLGASDMMFNGKLDSWFFSAGQVIETVRGKGIYQNALDVATKKLEEGQWVHIFPEGKIKQEKLNELRRFKWGISRMLMEAKTTPLIIPVFIRGFEEVMSEEASFPKRIPRPGKTITIVIGEPVNDAIEPLLATYRAKFPTPWRPTTYAKNVEDDLVDEPVEQAQMRSEMAEAIRQQLLQVGKRIEN